MTDYSVQIKKAIKNNSTSPYGIGMPPQKLSFKAKDKSWKESCINAIIGMGTSTNYNGRTSRYNKQVNYNLVNSIFDEKDFLYVTDPWGIGNTYGEAPARMENYNIIRNVVEFLKGDDLRRPFSFTAVAVGGESITVRQEYKANMLKDALAQYIQNEEAKYGLNQPTQDENGEVIPPKTPKQIEDYMSYSYKDIVEKQTNDILQYLYKKEEIVQKFAEGWEHGIISAEELYYVGIAYNEPILRVTNPLYFDYDKSPDVKTIQDAQWCREERFMTKGEVIDEYREYLTNEDLERLDMDDVGMSTSMSKFDAIAGFSYDEYINSTSNYNSNNNRSNYVNVNVCCWKTWKKIGFFSFTHPETGEEVKKIVEEDFKVPSEFVINKIEYKLEWEWINEVWSGVRIGNDVFINIGPIENQCRTLNNPSICKLPYVGRIYNSTNSVSTSIVDLLKKYQFFYNIIMYRVELEIAKAQGKKIIIDIAQIPQSKDMSLDKWMYYYSNTGIAFINSLEEGRPGDPNSVSKFNQFTSLDMSVDNLTTYLNILNKIEESVEKITGVTRQRLGETFSSESATGIQNSVVQSSIVTEYMYFQHNNVKKDVLTQLVEAAKIAYSGDNKTISYIGDDMARIFMDVDSERLNNSDVAVFISNSAKDLEVKLKTEGLLQAAMQNDKASMSDIIRVFKSNSTAELENIAKQIDAKQDQQLQQQQQLEQEAQQMQQQHEAELAAMDRQERQLDRDNKIAVAEIQSFSNIRPDNTGDTSDNSAELAVQMNEVLTRREEANTKTRLEYDKLIANQKNDEYRLGKESEMQDKELKYKQQELRSKEKIARSKPKPTKKK